MTRRQMEPDEIMVSNGKVAEDCKAVESLLACLSQAMLCVVYTVVHVMLRTESAAASYSCGQC